MAVKLIPKKPPPVNEDLVKNIEESLARAKSGEITAAIMVFNGPDGTDFSYNTEDELQMDMILGFFERVVKPIAAEEYAMDFSASS